MDKKELKKPDAFVETSSHLLRYVEAHAKTVFSALGLIVAVSVCYLAYSYWQSSSEKTAASSIYAAEAELRATQRSIEEERQKKLEDISQKASGKTEIPSPEQLRPSDFDRDFRSKVDKVMEALRENRTSRAALLSSLGLVDFLAEQKKWSLAGEVIAIPVYNPSPKDLLFGLTQLHKGLIALENSKPDEAIQFYQSVIGNADQKLLHPEALLKLGVCFESKQDIPKAREMYEKVMKDFSASESAAQAGQLLKLLDLRKAS